MYFLGSKKSLSPYINNIVQEFFAGAQSYVELFSGGLNIVPHLEQKFNKYFFNDNNFDLYNLYLAIKEDNYFEIKLLKLQKKHNKEEFYKEREKYNKTREPSILFYLLHTCYRSFYRVNLKSNNFNCPFGREIFAWKEEELKKTKEILLKSEIMCLNWLEAIRKVPNNSLFICDPPYLGTQDFYGKNFNDTNILTDFCGNHNSILFNSDYLKIKNNFTKVIEIKNKMKFSNGKLNPKRTKNQVILVNRL